MNPTIRDVAEKANVSISTVSRVCNNPNSVGQELRERVLKVIEEIGYTPNPFASGLRDNRSMTIVAMLPNISNPIYSEMYRGIEEIAREKRNNVIICNTEQREDLFLDHVDYFFKRKVDGMIFASMEMTDVYHQRFQALNIPVVLASTEGENWNLPSVKIHDFQASFDATTFLLKNGHTAIGMICGPLHEPVAGKMRFDGFQQAMERHNLTITNDHFAVGDWSFDSGYQAMAKLYAKMPDLTAVFAAGDAMAIGAMKFLHQRGLDVPRHVSVMGFDNLEIARMVTPSLTTVAQPTYGIGKKAAELLFHSIEGSQEPKQVVLMDHEIIVRETVWNRKVFS